MRYASLAFRTLSLLDLMSLPNYWYKKYIIIIQMENVEVKIV